MRAIKVSDCPVCGTSKSVIEHKKCAYTSCKVCDASDWCNCPKIEEEGNSMLDFIASELDRMHDSWNVAF